MHCSSNEARDGQQVSKPKKSWQPHLFPSLVAGYIQWQMLDHVHGPGSGELTEQAGLQSLLYTVT